MSVGIIRDPQLCDLIHKLHTSNPVVLWKVNETDSFKDETSLGAEIHPIEGADTKEILENILNLLPNPKLLDEKDFQVQFSISACLTLKL